MIRVDDILGLSDSIVKQCGDAEGILTFDI